MSGSTGHKKSEAGRAVGGTTREGDLTELGKESTACVYMCVCLQCATVHQHNPGNFWGQESKALLL